MAGRIQHGLAAILRAGLHKMHCNPCAQCRKLKFYLGGVINASLSGQLYGSRGQSSMIIYEMESLSKRQLASFRARLLPHCRSILSAGSVYRRIQIANLNPPPPI